LVHTFYDPIILPDGRELVTLKDATIYFIVLPKRVSSLPEWQAAVEALLLCSRGGDPLMARIGFKKSIKVMPKKRGRPATGKDPQIVARMPAESIANVDAWAEANKTMRSAAFRRLVEIGLKAKR
jgi:hypothetical protein